jgi:hypothetical protein
MTQERIREIDTRIEELEKLLSRSRNVTGSSLAEQGERQYWEDRKEELRLLIEERKRLKPN